MKHIILKNTMINQYMHHLQLEERSKATLAKYHHDILAFYHFLPSDKSITKEALLSYKQYLKDNYLPSSVNSMLVAINGLLQYLGLTDMKVKLVKIQRSSFIQEECELTKEEYKSLLRTAKLKNNQRLYMLLQTICATGIRVSEHRYITVEALKEGRAVIHNKGKTRVILIPKDLKKLLLSYCYKEGLKKGAIFVTRNGRVMDRTNIWKEMKKLCKEARVSERKVFPHNLRHLFAITYYRLKKDVVRLADILGHSSIETTRIYTMTSLKECQRSMERMQLVYPLT